MAKIQTEQEKQNLQTLAVINDWCTVHGVKRSDFGKRIGTSDGTGYNRLNEPGELRISEIRRMKGLTDEQIIRMIRGKMPEKQVINVYIDGSKLGQSGRQQGKEGYDHKNTRKGEHPQ